MYCVEGVEVVNLEKEMLWMGNGEGPDNGGKAFKWWPCGNRIIFMLLCSKEQNKDFLEDVTKKWIWLNIRLVGNGADTS